MTMSKDEMEAYLILKYGSTERAMLVWLADNGTTSPEETAILGAWSKVKWPNLDLMKLNRIG